MTSYHHLEKQVYEDIRATSFTRIHGRPTWRAKEKLLKEAKGPALKQRVSYNWAGQYGLFAEIIGAAKYALDNPAMPAHVAPAQPANTLNFPNNASGAIIKAATDANNLEKCDWAVICGFRRGVDENIQDALDLEFYSALENKDYSYLNVLLPRQYFVHLEQEYGPLDVIAIDDIKRRAL